MIHRETCDPKDSRDPRDIVIPVVPGDHRDHREHKDVNIPVIPGDHSDPRDQRDIPSRL